jgi:hypothetical protein
MGGFSAQVQQPQTDQPNQSMGKGGGQQYQSAPEDVQPQQPMHPMGKGGVQTNSATSGQPRAGMPNQYSNTVGQWDNARIQPQQPQYGGKGKGQ